MQIAVRGGPFAGVDRRVIQRRAHKMLLQLELDNVEWSIALVDNPTIQQLNRDFRGMDKPTDVLAFAMAEGEPVPQAADEPELLGDVVIAIPTARAQATKANKSLLAEVTMLLAHGLLHLRGYDHATKAEEKVMKRLTTQLEQAAQRRRSQQQNRGG